MNLNDGSFIVSQITLSSSETTEFNFVNSQLTIPTMNLSGKQISLTTGTFICSTELIVDSNTSIDLTEDGILTVGKLTSNGNKIKIINKIRIIKTIGINQ